MNVLPLIFAFLLVFSLVTASFLQKSQQTSDLFYSLKGEWNISRRLNNELERISFKDLDGEKQVSSKRKETSEKSERPYRSPRDSYNFFEEAKFSLHPLIEQTSVYQVGYMKNCFKKLLTSLYAGTSVERELFEGDNINKLTEEIFLSAKEARDFESFASLKIKDEKLQMLFYKLCKGTPQFFMKKKGAYPSLLYFVTLSDFGKDYCIKFAAASRPVLSALLGKDVADAVIEREQDKWENQNKRHSPLSPAELSEAIMKTSHKSFDHVLFENMVSFNRKQKQSPAIRLIDVNSGAFYEVYPNNDIENFLFTENGEEEE